MKTYVIKRGHKYMKNNDTHTFTTKIKNALIFYSLTSARWVRDYITDQIVPVDIIIKERKQ